jgi:hypothetical protein
MPADYLSRLPSLPVSTIEQPQVSPFDPFTPDLQLLQRQDNDLQAIFNFLKICSWPDSISKQTIMTLAAIAPKVFFDKKKTCLDQIGGSQLPSHSTLASRKIQKRGSL